MSPGGPHSPGDELKHLLSMRSGTAAFSASPVCAASEWSRRSAPVIAPVP